jgi:DNA-binding MarR family transcriptional regulator
MVSKRYYSSGEVTMSARETAALLLQAARIVQAEGYDGELSPAQWMALRFFASANQFSRTPSALADFQSTTRGTATQTIKALVAGGYLRQLKSKADRRCVNLQLTVRGRRAVARDPFESLVRAIAALDTPGRIGLHAGLQHVLASAGGTHRRFGGCRDCSHIRGDIFRDPTSAPAPAPQCQLFGVPMQPEEAELLCANFEPKAIPE